MIATRKRCAEVSFYVDGEWEGTGRIAASGDESGDRRSDCASSICDAAEVDRVVQAAHAAFLKWRDVPVVERVQVLYRYKALLEKHVDEIARTLTTRKRQDLRRRQAVGTPRRSRWWRSPAACRV